MQLREGERLMRVPSAHPNKGDGTAIVDKNNKLVAYATHIIGLNDRKPEWAWIRRD